LIKKLETLADKWEAGGTNGGGANSESDNAEAPKDDQMATTAPTKKSKVVKARGCKFGLKYYLFSLNLCF
jgi:hypothetical protein